MPRVCFPGKAGRYTESRSCSCTQGNPCPQTRPPFPRVFRQVLSSAGFVAGLPLTHCRRRRVPGLKSARFHASDSGIAPSEPAARGASRGVAESLQALCNARVTRHRCQQPNGGGESGEQSKRRWLVGESAPIIATEHLYLPREAAGLVPRTNIPEESSRRGKQECISGGA